MKKNTMMRVASVLLLAVLLTTCAISGTFAKYTSTGSGTDSARVAKWGFGTTTTLTIDLFDGSYNNVANSTSDGKKLIAPGTSKECSITLVQENQTAPEVAYKFDIYVSSNSSDSTLLNKLVWYVDGTKCGTNGSFSEFQTAIAKKSQTSVSANTLPTAQSLNVKWEWPFEVDESGNTADTELGNATSLAELSITFSFTATQID